jgi:hypothetical protein
MGLFDFLGGGIVGQIGKVIDSLHTSQEEKSEAKLQLEKLLQARDSEIEQTVRAEIQAKERIIVAEMNQGDAYTKRARPSIVYVGLGMMVGNFCLIPLISSVARVMGQDVEIAIQNFPEEFWWSWASVVATWSVGRSMEKRGVSSNLGRKVASVITGSGVFEGRDR